MIKGPDIFCDVVRKLSQHYPIYVFLTGPARGYVKNRLRDYQIPFQHVFLEDYLQIGSYFQLLDLYLVTSRAEGGPKAVLESLASGIPLVSTKVGMAPEVIIPGENGLLAEVEDIDEICTCTERFIEDPMLRKRCIQNGLETVKKYDWSQIVQQYYQKLYSQFL